MLGFCFFQTDRFCDKILMEAENKTPLSPAATPPLTGVTLAYRKAFSLCQRLSGQESWREATERFTQEIGVFCYDRV